MPYVKKTIIAGNTIEVEKHFTSRYQKKGIARRKNQKPTKEQQLKINERKSEQSLRCAINTNFGYGDYHLTLSYRQGEGIPEPTRESMSRDWSRFTRRLKKKYQEQGKELKFIHIMEIGKKGARHHHAIINRIDSKIIQEVWNETCEYGGYIGVQPLDDTGDYKKLASYLIKYTSKHRERNDPAALMGKRWVPSRNLKKPTVLYEIVKDQNAFSYYPKAKKGYYIDPDSVYKDTTDPDSEFFGFSYIRYRMIKLPEKPKGRRMPN